MIPDKSTLTDYDSITIVDLLLKMAKILSSKINDQILKNYIKQKALKKFDEDYNFLFSDSYGAILNPAKDASFIDSVLLYYPLMQFVVPERGKISPDIFTDEKELGFHYTMPFY